VRAPQDGRSNQLSCHVLAARLTPTASPETISSSADIWHAGRARVECRDEFKSTQSDPQHQ
jgi:hypothetical protein